MEMRYLDNWTYARERWIGWWRGEEYERPLMRVTAPNGQRPRRLPPASSLEQRWTDPDYVAAAHAENMRCTYWAGEGIPAHVVNLGPSIMAAYLGAPLHLMETTTWPDPIVDDWDQYEPHFDQGNRWWQATKRITEACVEASGGSYAVGITDLGGAEDVISYLRGPERMCLDVLERPEVIKRHLDWVIDLWMRLYDELWAITRRATSGSTGWLRAWSPGRYYPLQCDFSCMISAQMFEDLVIPGLERLTRWLDHSIYHWDGPGALQHLDALLDLPHLDGIQWTPGAGNPTVSHWPDQLIRIQRRGKLLWLFLSPAEVKRVLEYLSPRGVFIETSCGSMQEADDLLRMAVAWSQDAPRR
ncbi:MAG: hypothetical protein ACE5R4_17255, partial [Armatimonadota bacterium]